MSKKRKNNTGSIATVAAIVIVVLAAFIAGAVLLSSHRGSAPVTSGSGAMTLLAPLGTTVDVGNTQKISWSSIGAVPSTVSVRLIKKVASNPNRYEVVRTIAVAKTNNGMATWVPATIDVGNGLSIEIGCTLTDNACTAAEGLASPLAVVNDGRFANTASAYQAIEAAQNK
jgi:hypothetical protein